jgi:hypothetical protein
VQLPDLLIVRPFPHFRQWKWSPPPVPAFAGPKDLSQVLISYRAKLEAIRQEGGRPSEELGDLPDNALEPLLTAAYKASFLTEEGRPVRATIYTPPRPWNLDADDQDGALPAFREVLSEYHRLHRQRWEEATHIHRLGEPLVLDDPKHIARFSPTLAVEDAVLVVREREGRLVIKGISLLDASDAESGLLQMPRLWHGVGGLFVHILGPGELRVSEGRGEYTLRANKIRVYQAVSHLPHVRQWLEEATRDLVVACSVDPAWDADPIGEPEAAVVDLMLFWSRVLREAVRLRHGGAFIVVPDVRVSPYYLEVPTRAARPGPETGADLAVPLPGLAMHPGEGR